MDNVAKLKKHLAERNLHLKELNDEEGNIFFRVTENFSNGGSVTLVIWFNENQSIIELKLYELALITDPLKKESLHNLLNELNNTRRFEKYSEFEGQIEVEYSLVTSDESFSPADTMYIVFAMLDGAREAYPKFMKLQWA